MQEKLKNIFKITLSKEILKKYIHTGFLTPLLLIIYSEIFSSSFFGFSLSDYFLGKIIIDTIDYMQSGLIVFAVVMGGLLFYLDRDKIETAENEIEEEIKEEEKRKSEFGEKYPKLNRLLFLRWIFKWMYGEGLGYSLGLVGIVVLGFVLKYYISMSFIQDNDEMYTYMVIEGYNKYGKIGITPSGEIYDDKTLLTFHYLSTIFYNFFFNNGFNKLFSLRSFSIILSTTLTPILYLFIKKISDKKIALLSIFLISTNWYLVMTFVIARPYVFFSIGSVIASLFLLIIFKNIINKNNISVYDSRNLLLCTSLLLLIFFEGHILGLYHNLVLILILIVYLLLKLENKKIYKLAIVILILNIIFVSYLYLFKYSFLDFIIYTYKPYFKYEILSIFGNQISYLTNTGVIIGLIILSGILILNKNKYISILVIYILISTVFIHGYIFGTRLFSFRYLSDYLILFLISISYLIKNINNKKIYYIFFTIYLISNSYNIYQIFNDNLNRSLFYKNSTIKDYMYCNKYNNIASDSPATSYFYKTNKSTLYSLPSFNDVYHIDNTRYLYLNIYAIENTKHLNNILLNKGNICFIFSHNQYNDTGNFGNIGLFKEVMENGKIIRDDMIYNRIFGTGKSPYSNKHNGTVLIMDNSFINKDSQNKTP